MSWKIPFRLFDYTSYSVDHFTITLDYVWLCVYTQVVKRLSSLFPGMYNETNVCISGIHTHSGPGGFHQYVLFDVTSLGFVRESMDALVEGIVEVNFIYVIFYIEYRKLNLSIYFSMYIIIRSEFVCLHFFLLPILLGFFLYEIWYQQQLKLFSFSF